MDHRTVNRTTRLASWVALVVGLPLVVFLVFLLAVSTKNTAEVNPLFGILYWINLAVAALLLLLILGLSSRLLWRLRKRRFGSRLLFKLAMVFTLVGVLPGLIIYVVSYQFVARSIETWFDVKVERALTSGLNLGRTTLNVLLADLGAKGRNVAGQVVDSRGEVSPVALEQLLQQLSLEQATVFDGNGNVVASAGGNPFALVPDLPGAEAMRQLRLMGQLASVEGGEDGVATASSQLRLRVVIPLPTRSLLLPGHQRYLLLVQNVPSAISRSALEVQRAYAEYQERALGRDGLRRMYISTLTLTLFLTVFAAVLLAVVLGNQLASPLLMLADGMRAVAGGDLRQRPEARSGDELGSLTRSFNAMTAQLADARQQAEASRQALEASRAYLQSVLDNLSAGVLVLDDGLRLTLANPSATRVLRVAVQGSIGQAIASVAGLKSFAAEIETAFHELGAGSSDHWLRQLDYTPPGSDTPVTLLVRGARLLLPNQGAAVVVFDDISELISAQRSLAWGEVARRLAHEIKNPLTPIQLSAERLQMKLEARLSGADRDMLTRATGTIVNQVTAMRRMVDEFRDYARTPVTHVEPMDLNVLVGDVLNLYAAQSAHVHAELGPSLPTIEGDAAQLRQVVHNLVQNALDAIAGQEQGGVTIHTDTYRSGGSGAQRVRLSVSDTGPGFSEKVLARAFEPYVTTKLRGTGLGLAVVKKIAEEHHARVEVQNLGTPGATSGARVSLIFPAMATPPASGA
ncbi:MAG: HAMP domain-containing protein [Betaproteobacteria bacterium]|nr:HAMP domain-containing protein [Betaproteobacteria bacterium]MDE2152667.1 HAMP domain-containing protein [Betaproteobacteria bacterium]